MDTQEKVKSLLGKPTKVTNSGGGTRKSNGIMKSKMLKFFFIVIAKRTQLVVWKLFC